MHSRSKYYMLQLLLKLIFIPNIFCDDEGCNKIPLGSKTAALPPDNRFVLQIGGIDEKYIPGAVYNVTLQSRDEKSTFIAFTILIKGDEKLNDKNVRKPIPLEPGRLGIWESSNDVILKENCENVLTQSNLTPKNYVAAIWTAPPKGNKCVTISAAVAIKQDVWFSSEGPLSKRVCEDLRKAEDMQPNINSECQACGDARYLMTFEGTWSSNTHPRMFPAPGTSVRFSDVVGAAHNEMFSVYTMNTEASEGLQTLAEQGNTTVLEREIIAELGNNVRTVIKATGPPSPNMSTVAMFRVSPRHHLVSLVSAVLPSPDWFLGVANFELCDENEQDWTPHTLLNLYLMDAGTDSGGNFTAANEVTLPQQPISSASILSRVPKEQVKPFAILKFDLIRTYGHNVRECMKNKSEAKTKKLEETYEENTNEESNNVVPTETYYPPSTVQPSDPSDPCPMTEWQPWLPCDGECKQQGTQMRTRDHILNNIPLGNYGENLPEAEIPRECLEINTSEFQECEVVCEENEDIEQEAKY